MKILISMLAVAGFTAVASAQAGLVADIRPGLSSSNPTSITAYQNLLCFVANDGTHGAELYRFDGHNAPVRITDLNPAGDGVFGFDGKLGTVDNRLFFAGNDGSKGFELYAYSSATGSVQLVADIEAGSGDSRPYYFTEINNVLYFSAQTAANGRELYSYDPATNTVSLHDIVAGAASSDPGPMVSFNNRLYFSATAAATGRELYYYDPASNSSGLAADISAGTTGSAPLSLVPFAGNLYFNATTAANGRELYSFDGASANRLTNLSPGAGDGILNITNNLGLYNGKLYFPSSSGNASFFSYVLSSYTLSNGAVRVIASDSSRLLQAPSNFTLHNGQLYFSAFDTLRGMELRYLTTDSSAALGANVNPGPADSYPAELTSWGGRLFFRAVQPATGAELFGFPYINTAVPLLAAGTAVRAFPNPAHDELCLQLEPAGAGPLHAELLDLNGRVLQRQTAVEASGGTVSLHFPLGGLPADVYSYRIAGSPGQGAVSGLFVKD